MMEVDRNDSLSTLNKIRLNSFLKHQLLSGVDMDLSSFRSLSDGSLIDLFQSGEVTAFDTLLERYRPLILSTAFRIMRNKDEAETVAQEAALRVFRNLQQFAGQSKFSTWLYRITENVSYTAYAKNRRRLEVLDAYAIETDGSSYTTTPESEADFTAMIAGLTTDEKQLVVLRFVEDRELRDIAIILDIGLSATKMRLYRALDKLREQQTTPESLHRH
jgi:RNA polymerase sigma-70 factor (ECF subfamily)